MLQSSGWIDAARERENAAPRADARATNLEALTALAERRQPDLTGL